jgi:predicted metal-dependent phosphoesterase TrpH
VREIGPVLKAELHAHTSDDPRDSIPHSTPELIDCAARHGYHVLALTLHDRSLDIAPFLAHAEARGVVLIRGIERTIDGRHVLLLNFDERAERVNDFRGLAALRRAHPHGVVIAPHPFYPGQTCLGPLLDRHPELFDALEYNAFYTSAFNSFNARAVEWAARHGKPVVGNSDVHRLRQMGTTYTLIDAQPTADEICAAIRAGRVGFRTAPLSAGEAFAHLGSLAAGEVRRLFKVRRAELRAEPASTAMSR